MVAAESAYVCWRCKVPDLQGPRGEPFRPASRVGSPERLFVPMVERLKIGRKQFREDCAGFGFEDAQGLVGDLSPGDEADALRVRGDEHSGVGLQAGPAPFNLRTWRRSRLGAMKRRPEYQALPSLSRRIVDYSVRAHESPQAGITISQTKLAKHFGFTRETINRHLRRIEKAGVFVKQRRQRGAGDHPEWWTTNSYRLNPLLLSPEATKCHTVDHTVSHNRSLRQFEAPSEQFEDVLRTSREAVREESLEEKVEEQALEEEWGEEAANSRTLVDAGEVQEQEAVEGVRALQHELDALVQADAAVARLEAGGFVWTAAQKRLIDKRRRENPELVARWARTAVEQPGIESPRGLFLAGLRTGDSPRPARETSVPGDRRPESSSHPLARVPLAERVCRDCGASGCIRHHPMGGWYCATHAGPTLDVVEAVSS